MTVDYDAHRQSMVARYILLREWDRDYCHAQITEYAGPIGRPRLECPCPTIRADVEAAWNAREARRAMKTKESQ